MRDISGQMKKSISPRHVSNDMTFIILINSQWKCAMCENEMWPIKYHYVA